jgi:hypothetical protein
MNACTVERNLPAIKIEYIVVENVQIRLAENEQI